MDVSTLKTPEPWQPVSVNKASGATPAEGTAKMQPQITEENSVETASQPPKFEYEDVQNLTSKLNEFMESLDVNIHFDIHEKTQRIMVRVMDSKEQRVLREYPPQELLDTLGAISDYVGVLLDKKA